MVEWQYTAGQELDTKSKASIVVKHYVWSPGQQIKKGGEVQIKHAKSFAQTFS